MNGFAKRVVRRGNSCWELVRTFNRRGPMITEPRAVATRSHTQAAKAHSNRSLPEHSLLLLEFPKPLDNQIPSHGTEVSNEQDSVAVISLVQETTSSQPAGFPFKSFPLHVLSSQHRMVGSFELCMDLTNRQAGFLAALFTIDRSDFGIGSHQLDAFTVHDKQTKRQTDLRCGQADTASIVHRLEHVLDQRFQLAVKTHHRLTG